MPSRRPNTYEGPFHAFGTEEFVTVHRSFTRQRCFPCGVSGRFGDRRSIFPRGRHRWWISSMKSSASATLMTPDNIVLRRPPRRLYLRDYEVCRRNTIRCLERSIPDAAIFELGGTEVLPGFSDLDFLVVSDRVDGNRLYLRRPEWKWINRKGILRHECFAVDGRTYLWLDRLTSYQLRRANALAEETERRLARLPRREIDRFVTLGLYLICNYQMHFVRVYRTNVIEVVHDFSKLKKLRALDEVSAGVFGRRVVPSWYADGLREIADRYWTLTDRQIAREMFEMLRAAGKIVYRFFELFEEFAGRLFGRTDSEDGFLCVGNDKLRFSDEWRRGFVNGDGSYNLPRSLGCFIQILDRVERGFRMGIEYGGRSRVNNDLQDISTVIDSYLEYCDRSSVAQLIFDVRFSMRGHDSALCRAVGAGKRVRGLVKRGRWK